MKLMKNRHIFLENSGIGVKGKIEIILKLFSGMKKNAWKLEYNNKIIFQNMEKWEIIYKIISILAYTISYFW